MKRFACLLIVWLPVIAGGQIVLDGNSNDASWRVLGLVNTTGTPNNSFGATNTLGTLKYHSNATTLFLAITGDIDQNNNIVLFIDNTSYNGRGPNRLGANMSGVTSTVFRTSSGSCPVPQPNGLSGAILDAGFDADYAFAFNKGNTTSDLYLDVVRYSNYLNDGITPAYLAGPHFVGTSNQLGATASHSFNITNWNTNGNTISFAWQNGYDASTAPHRGLELSIPYDALPGTTVGNQVRFFVLITNSEGRASNVCIPGDPGPSNLGCSFNLSTISNPGEDIFYTEPMVVLPVNFIRFDGVMEEGVVKLEWSVSEEQEVLEYVVERSRDGLRFESIGRVLSAGAGGIGRYEYLDRFSNSGKNFYRVVVRRRDGGRSYSQQILIENQQVSLLSIYPNPASDRLFVRVGESLSAPARWELLNQAGQRVLEGILNPVTPVECVQLPNSLSAGTYRFRAFLGGRILSRTLLISR
jgi:hypothetical protein